MVRQLSPLEFEECGIRPVELVQVVTDQEPEGIIDDSVQMLFADSGASKHGERAAHRLRVAEGICVGQQAQREIADPRQPVAFHAVDQEVIPAEPQRIGRMHPDSGELRIGRKCAPVPRRGEDGAADDFDRGAGFDAQVAERERLRRRPDSRGGFPQFRTLLEMRCVAVFKFGERLPAPELRTRSRMNLNPGEQLASGVVTAGSELHRRDGELRQPRVIRCAARNGGRIRYAVRRCFPVAGFGGESGDGAVRRGNPEFQQPGAGLEADAAVTAGFRERERPAVQPRLLRPAVNAERKAAPLRPAAVANDTERRMKTARIPDPEFYLFHIPPHAFEQKTLIFGAQIEPARQQRCGRVRLPRGVGRIENRECGTAVGGGRHDDGSFMKMVYGYIKIPCIPPLSTAAAGFIAGPTG